MEWRFGCFVCWPRGASSTIPSEGAREGDLDSFAGGCFQTKIGYSNTIVFLGTPKLKFWSVCHLDQLASYVWITGVLHFTQVDYVTWVEGRELRTE